MKKQLKEVFFYTSSESFIYQLTLTLHQIALYTYVGPAHYGFIGTLFSLIYLAIMYLNLGLDSTLGSVFNDNRGRMIAIRHMYAQMCINGIGCFFIGLILCIITPTITISWLLICLLFVISESAKKTWKTALYLLFFHRCIAFIEIAALYMYITGIWICLLSGYHPSIELIFMPLLLLSAGVGIGYYYIFSQYAQNRSLQISASKHADISWQKMVQLRLKNYFYQISHSVYSPNLLVPIIALYYDAQLAGLIKVLSMAIYAINNIIQHTFGITTNVLFASIKIKPHTYKQAAFNLLQRYFYQTAIIMLAVISVLYYYLIPTAYPYLLKHHIHIVYLFLLLMYSEHMAIIHERFFITEEHVLFLTILNICLYLPIILYTAYATTPFTLLLWLLSSRLLYIFTIHLYGWYHWRLRLSFTRRDMYMSFSITSIMIYLLLTV